MATRLSRKELYDLVWSEPIKVLAARFGISDVALRKTCDRAQVPTPERGYWAKKEVGKETPQAEFTERAPGMDDEVIVAGGSDYRYHHGLTEEELLAPIPQAPEFSEPIEQVRKRIQMVIGQVMVPNKVTAWHPVIQRLLREDEKRREKQRASGYSWDAPLFDTPFERRRLRILNSLFLAINKMNGKPYVYGREYGRESREIRIGFYQQYISISLDPPKPPRRGAVAGEKTTKSEEPALVLTILDAGHSEKSLLTWQDNGVDRVEQHLTEAAIEIVLTAEVQYRKRALSHHQWLIERRTQLGEEQRQKKLAAERAERERQIRLEEKRIERLLLDAEAFQQADVIRKYVEAICSDERNWEKFEGEKLEQWRRWALGQADSIDPVQDGAFLRAMNDDESEE